MVVGETIIGGGGGGEPETWHEYAAGSNVDMGGNDAGNIGNLYATSAVIDSNARKSATDGGDYVLLKAMSPVHPGIEGGGGSNTSTSSSTYTSVHGSWGKSGVMDLSTLQFPSNSDGFAYVQAEIIGDAGGDTLYYRMYDNTNATALTGTEATITGSGWTTTKTPIVQYDPGGPIQFSGQFKNADGATAVDIYNQHHIYVYTKVI